MSGKAEAVGYGAVLALVYGLAVMPHVLEYGWAWGWPGGNAGFAVAILGSAVTLLMGLVAIVCVIVMPKRPRWRAVARLVAVPVIVLGPGIVFNAFGGLATSLGRGLAARVRTATPLDSLQTWAVRAAHESPPSPLPDDVAKTLPPRPTVTYAEDHVTLQWYDRGIAVGSREFRSRGRSFFDCEIRPGVYVYVVEH
jgi:hypothetical protein